jgi:RNA polymerase sigma factor (sigma-70 family)
MPMAGDRSNFWELPVDPATLEELADAPPGSETPRSSEAEEARREAIAMLGVLITTALTTRQRRLIELYYFQRKTQAEIARELGVSQQAVSRQLFGVLRRGRRVGGAIQRLRKACADLGIDPDRWV